MKPKKPETLEQFIEWKFAECETATQSSAKIVTQHVLAHLRKRVRKLKVEDTGLIDSIYNSTIDEVLKLLRWK